MDILEAKQILNNNGYELLEEGKLGRILGAGALALGLAAGNANAINQDDIDRFEKQTEQEYDNVIFAGKNYYVYKQDSSIIIDGMSSKTTIDENGKFNFIEYEWENPSKILDEFYGKTPNNLYEKIKKGDLSNYKDWNDLMNELLDNNNLFKTIEYKNGKKNRIEYYKNGENYKTLCPDGKIVHNYLSYYKDETINNCTGKKHNFKTGE